MSEHPVDDELRELGKQLPWQRPDAARRDAVKQALLVAATQPAAPANARWGLVGGAFVAGVVAAAAVFVLVVRPREAAAPARSVEARLDAPSTTRFDREVTRTAQGVDEIVHVHDGALKVAVGTAPAGSRFRVATRDAEVEGAGAYRVVVEDDVIREVAVEQGSAVLRVQGHAAVFLATGQTWKAEVVTAAIDLSRGSADAAANAPAPAIAAVPAQGPDAKPAQPAHGEQLARAQPAHVGANEHVASSEHDGAREQDANASLVTSAPTTATPDAAGSAHISEAVPVTALEPPAGDRATTEPAQPATAAQPAHQPPKNAVVEQHFKAGWQLLKAGKAAEAARELGAAADAGGDDPLAADARYFQATALVRAGRKTEAEQALVAFLDRAHTSLRRGRAAVMLARLIAERGDAASAKSWFESALGDADPDVVAAARAGLARL